MTAKKPLKLFHAEEIFLKLPGMWQLSRKVANLGVFEGQAHFSTPLSLTLRYREEGVLHHFSGAELEGFREFDFRLILDTIAIDFVEDHRRGNRYVDLRFDRRGSSLVAQGIHECPPDTYVHRMKWVTDDSFNVVIDVRGPAKNFRLVSTYERHHLLALDGGQAPMSRG